MKIKLTIYLGRTRHGASRFGGRHAVGNANGIESLSPELAIRAGRARNAFPG